MITPAFFDIFGFGGFIYIFIVAFLSLKKLKPLPKWAYIILLLISALGLIIDGSIILKNFIIK